MNKKNINIKKMQIWDKKNLLLVIAIICLILYFYGPKSIPLVKHLSLTASFFSLVDLLANEIATAENN